MWHTAGWASCILLAGAVFILVQTHLVLARDATSLADTIKRLLEVQLLGITAENRTHQGFPDWQVVSQVLNERVGCLRLWHLDGRIWRSECRGEDRSDAGVPHAFTAVYRRVFRPGVPLTREIDDARGLVARLELEPSVDAEIAVAWRASRRLGSLIAATTVALSLMVFGLTARALRPAASISGGLARLQSGDLGVRLTPGRFEEIAQLAVAVNRLAESLAASETTRTRLANRLSSVQEEERQHLSRELHDEFGQHLAGIAGIAASIRHGASDVDAGTVSAATRIEAIVHVLQDQLRQLLATLRPPGLAEVGLAASLESLIRQWNYQLNGRLAARLIIRGDVNSLGMPLAVSVYRIVQESLTNAVRHAAASEVRVLLTRRDAVPADHLHTAELIELRVEDDGQPELAGGPEVRSGLGRRGIEERVAAVQGRVEFGATPAERARIHALLPVTLDERGT